MLCGFGWVRERHPLRRHPRATGNPPTFGIKESAAHRRLQLLSVLSTLPHSVSQWWAGSPLSPSLAAHGDTTPATRFEGWGDSWLFWLDMRFDLARVRAVRKDVAGMGSNGPPKPVLVHHAVSESPNSGNKLLVQTDEELHSRSNSIGKYMQPRRACAGATGSYVALISVPVASAETAWGSGPTACRHSQLTASRPCNFQCAAYLARNQYKPIPGTG